MTNACDCSKVSGDHNSPKVSGDHNSAPLHVFQDGLCVTQSPTPGGLGMAQSGWGQWSRMVDRSVTSSWEMNTADELSSVAKETPRPVWILEAREPMLSL